MKAMCCMRIQFLRITTREIDFTLRCVTGLFAVSIAGCVMEPPFIATKKPLVAAWMKLMAIRNRKSKCRSGFSFRFFEFQTQPIAGHPRIRDMIFLQLPDFQFQPRQALMQVERMTWPCGDHDRCEMQSDWCVAS